MDLAKYIPIAREVEALVVEAATLKMLGPRFVIGHRFCRDGVCAPGEEVAFIALEHRGRRFFLRLSPSQCLLVEALARNSRYNLNATQIAAFMRSGEFFKRHARNAIRNSHPRGISRKAIKVHVQRIRKAMDAAFAEAGMTLKASEVLRTDRMDGPLGYRLVASCQKVHLDLREHP